MIAIETQLILHEGLCYRPYRDTVGKLTVGVGHNIDDNGLPPAIRKYLTDHEEITRDMAMTMLDQDIKVCEAELDRHLSWWRTMSTIRQKVMIDLAFNLGMETLLDFKKTLQLLHIKKYNEASKELLNSKWAAQVGQRAIRLANMLSSGKDYA